MPLMQEAMSKAEWEAREAGKPIPKRVREERPEPTPPKVEKLLAFESIPLDRFVRLVSAAPKNMRNQDGMSFVGFEVEIEIKYAEGTKKVQKSKALDTIMAEDEKGETYILSGWLPEGEWMKFRRAMKGKVDFSVLNM